MSGFAGISVGPEIVRRAQNGDVRAHEIIFRAFSPAVYTLARRIVQCPTAADDLLQDTFIEVIRSIAAFRGDASLSTWIRHVAVSKCLMFVRSAWQQRVQFLGDELPKSDAAPGADANLDERSQLSTALSQISAQGRAVVWLHDVEGYTHKEIGALMSRSESFSKSQLARAHKTLRVLLASSQSEDAPLAATAEVPCQ